MFKISVKVFNFLKNVLKNLKVELAVEIQTQAGTRIQKGIFQEPTLVTSICDSNGAIQ